MDTTPSTNDLSSPSNTELTAALSNWLTTLAQFRTHYSWLSSHIDSSDQGQLLTELVAVMHWELATLLLEVNQLPPATTPHQEVERLRAHTARLAPFTQQAAQLQLLTEP